MYREDMFRIFNQQWKDGHTKTAGRMLVMRINTSQMAGEKIIIAHKERGKSREKFEYMCICEY